LSQAGAGDEIKPESAKHFAVIGRKSQAAENGRETGGWKVAVFEKQINAKGQMETKSYGKKKKKVDGGRKMRRAGIAGTRRAGVDFGQTKSKE